jgi:hypothetical protein
MAVDTTIDNAVIDFTSISNLLQTLKTHDDLFMKFASGSLGSYTPVGSEDSIGMSASIFQMVGVKVKGTMQKDKPWPKKVAFGKSFQVAPTVVLTVSAKTTGSILVAQLTEEPGLDSCTISVSDINRKFAGDFVVNILALGPTANA